MKIVSFTLSRASARGLSAAFFALPRASARCLSAGLRKAVAHACACAALAWPLQALAVPAGTQPQFPPPYVQSTLTSGNAVSSYVTNPVTAGLVAEYPFNEGSGTVVHDISGNGNTANFGSGGLAPTWGTWGVQFSNPGSFGLTQQGVLTPLTSWKTVLIYACIGLPVGTTGTSTGGSPVANAPTFWGTNTSSYGVTLTTSTTGQLGNGFYNGGIAPAIFSQPAGAFKTWGGNSIPAPCGVISATLSTSDHIYFNGTEIAYLTQGASASSVAVTGGYYNFGYQNNTATIFKGTIGYAAVYSTVLTQGQIAQVSAFMTAQVAARPGFPLPQSKQHTINAQAIFIGDSLTASYNGNAQWPSSTYVSTTNAYTFTNLGIGGQFAATNVSVSPLREGTIVGDGSGRDICHIWEGTNDVANGMGITQTALAIQVHAAEARAEGCKRVIVATMISRIGQDSNKDSLNGWLRLQWHGFADALNDLAAVPNIGADGAYANTSSPACFNSDNTHLTGPSGTGSCMGTLTGYAFVGKQVGRLINMLDGATLDDPTVTTSNAYAEADADNFLLQTPTAAATNILPDCLGFTGIKRRITNGSNSYAITVSGSGNTSTITGSNSVAVNASAEFTCMLSSVSAGGNYWLRTQ